LIDQKGGVDADHSGRFTSHPALRRFARTTCSIPSASWSLPTACQLEAAGGDAAFVAKALGDIARAKGMAQVARDAGLSRESLYQALSGERSPGFDTVLKVIRALALKLRAKTG
jgi:probable addiction module antidote protein